MIFLFGGVFMHPTFFIIQTSKKLLSAQKKGCDTMSIDATASNNVAKEKQKRRKKSNKARAKNLMLATDSAIERLEKITRPGGEIEDMDIKELKSLISSIRDLAAVSTELTGEAKQAGGIVILPEVKQSDE